MFCAPRRMLVSRIAFETSESAVNGGQTTMSTSFTLTSSRLMPPTRSSASATVLFIFQLPAMINFRPLSMLAFGSFAPSILSPVRQRGHSRQHLAFEKFQTRAAAGAHERHLVCESGHVQRLYAVAAADDA